MSRRLENFYPYLLAASTGTGWFWLDLRFPDAPAILASSVTIGSIITGFMGTSSSMLMSLNRPIMDSLRASGFIDDLASYLTQTICLSFFCAVLAIIGYFDSVAKAQWFGVLWITLGVAAAASFFRVMFLIMKILRRASPT